MKKCTIALLLLTALNYQGFAQTKAKDTKPAKPAAPVARPAPAVKPIVKHAAPATPPPAAKPVVKPVPVVPAKSVKPVKPAAHAKPAAPAKPVVKQPAKPKAKAVTKKQAGEKKGIPALSDSYIFSEQGNSTIVEFRQGNVYVNDSMVFSIKNLKAEEHKITINYVAPPPPAVPLASPVPEAEAAHNSGNISNSDNNNDDKPMLGVFTTTAPHGGALIEDVVPHSPAYNAGLFPNDVITKVDDKEINTAGNLSEVIGDHNAGDNVAITFDHRGMTQNTKATLAKKPEKDADVTTKAGRKAGSGPHFVHGRWQW